MITRDLIINDTMLHGYEIELKNAMLVVLTAPKGFIMCGYLNVEAADKFKDIAAIVRGIRSIDELLAAEISTVSIEAAKVGIKVGMTGKQAISLMI
jgi:uncharacterized protein YunC (DUF1805 family)